MHNIDVSQKLPCFALLRELPRTLCCTLSRSCKTNNHTETHENNPKPTVQTGCTPVATVDGFVVLALVLGRAHFSHSAVQQVSVSAAERMVRDDIFYIIR